MDVYFSKDRMHGSHRSIRLTGSPFENEGINALPSAAPSRAQTSRSNRKKISRDPKRSFNVGRRKIDPGRMLVDDR